MLEITHKGLVGWDNSLIDDYKCEFSDKRCVILPRLLNADILENMLAKLDTGNFYEDEHLDKDNKQFGTELTLKGDSIVLHGLHLLLNNPLLFQAIEEITGIKGIKGFFGRIYRNMPESEHHLDWHDDIKDNNRLIGVSMNLNREKYSGGVFQLRQIDSKELIREVPCGNAGDTHLFMVSPELQHRVTKTMGSYPRTAAAGWFLSIPCLGLPTLFPGQVTKDI